MKHLKRIITLTPILFTLLLGGCSQTADSASSASSTNTDYKFGKIDIPGLSGSLCSAPIYIAYENGYYAEEGFDVNLISADFEAMKLGLNNGTIPMVNGDFQYFPSMESGIDAKVVDGLHNGCIKMVVLPDSDISKVEDLKGKKIGVDEIGGTPHQVASVWLENAGISALPEDNEVTFLPFSDGNLELEALYSGEIDVAAMWDPLGSVSLKQGKTKLLFDLSTDPAFENKYCCFLFASGKVLKEEPEKIAALLRAYRKAQDFISKNPEETVDIIIEGKYSQIEDKELAVDLINSYEYPSYEFRESGAHSISDDVSYFAKGLHDIGYLNTESDEFMNKFYENISVDE